MTKEEKFKAQMQKILDRAAQFPARTVWKIRIILLGLLGIWIAGALYFHYQVKQDEQRIEQARIEQARHDEFLRRGAQYRQDLQERTNPSRVRNAFDGR